MPVLVMEYSMQREAFVAAVQDANRTKVSNTSVFFFKTLKDIRKITNLIVLPATSH